MRKQTLFNLFSSLFLMSFVCLSNHYSASLFGASDASAVQAPVGRHILIDGRLGLSEWSDAKQITASDSVNLYFKRDKTYLYIAVKPSTPSQLVVDLYFSAPNPGKVLNLHASAKLGEREGASDSWPEWKWWNNSGWTANVVRPDVFEERKFLPDEAKEFQIELGKLKEKSLRLSLDVYTGGVMRALPKEGYAEGGRKWIILRL